mmetsp:Transcript_49487/g.159806  ORF Transcript_49487/g.159806 Transcript_49487/m.159806 type:complete len:363 (-) Transcript_49487:501-1589(-)
MDHLVLDLGRDMLLLPSPCDDTCHVVVDDRDPRGRGRDDFSSDGIDQTSVDVLGRVLGADDHAEEIEEEPLVLLVGVVIQDLDVDELLRLSGSEVQHALHLDVVRIRLVPIVGRRLGRAIPAPVLDYGHHLRHTPPQNLHTHDAGILEHHVVRGPELDAAGRPIRILLLHRVHRHDLAPVAQAQKIHRTVFVYGSFDLLASKHLASGRDPVLGPGRLLAALQRDNLHHLLVRDLAAVVLSDLHLHLRQLLLGDVCSDDVAIAHVRRPAAGGQVPYVRSIGDRHQDRKEQEGENALPRIHHMRRDQQKDYDHPDVSENGEDCRDGIHLCLLDLTDLAVGDRADADRDDDEEVEGRAPDNGRGS